MNIYRIKGYPGQIGHPQVLSQEKVLKAVRRLCKGRYVKTAQFPPALYKQCRTYFGSVRAAKWEAGVINDRRWNYEKFIQFVRKYCKKKIQNEAWPPYLRGLARRFCGSVRAAMWEAGILQDSRRKERRVESLFEGKWTKKKFLRWVKSFCKKRGEKVGIWPTYMRLVAMRYFHSIREAKLAAGALYDSRRKKR